MNCVFQKCILFHQRTVEVDILLKVCTANCHQTCTYISDHNAIYFLYVIPKDVMGQYAVPEVEYSYIVYEAFIVVVIQ